MTGKQLIKIIEDQGLEDFKVLLSHEQKTDNFPSFKIYKIEHMEDIGYNDKVLVLSIKESC